MPYTSISKLLPRSFHSEGLVSLASAGVISSFSVSTPTDYVVGAYETRSGSNSSTSDLIQQFGTKAFRKVIRSTIVGWDFKRVEKTVYYRDARGNTRSRIKSRYVKVPRKVRTLQLVLAEPKSLKSADRTRFLKPNPLSYRRGVSFQTPKTLTIDSRVLRPIPPSEVIGNSRHLTISGPGTFFHPNHSGFLSEDSMYFVGNALEHPPTYPFPDANLDERALSKLLDKVSSSLPDYFLSLAESPKTIDLIKVVLIEALKMAKMIYRLKLREIAGTFLRKSSSLKDLSDYWLAWWYGIMPIVYDVQDTLLFLSEKERLWRSYSARAVRTETVETSPLLGALNISGKSVDTFSITSKYGVIVEGRLGFNDYLLKASKPLDNAALIYELIPLSFVLDWIIDIGSYLSGLEVLEDKVYHAWSTHTVERSSFTYGKYVDNAVYPFRMHASVPFVAGYTSLSLERVPLSVLPVLKFPRVAKPVVNSAWVKKTVTTLALEVQQLHRLF